MHEKLKDALILFSEIAGLLAVFLLFLLVLGYFKVIALPNFSLKTTTPNNSIPIRASLVATPTPALENLQNQYLTYAEKNLQGPQLNAATKTYSITGAYLSAANGILRIATAIGPIDFKIDSLTVFQTYKNSATLTSDSPYIKALTQDNFIKDLKEGTLIQVSYVYGATNPKALSMTATKDFAK